MSGENTTQQGHRTPRLRHKHSKSAAAPVSDSDSFNPQTQGSHKKGNRRNQRNGAHQAHQAQPAWQDTAHPQMEGHFDGQGNFVGSQQVQATQIPGMFYVNNVQHVPQAQNGNHPGRKPRPKNAQYLNGTGTPPRPASDNEQFFTAPMMHNMTPAKAAAYAGPTFHASPAANALPMPKFFSKSVPNDPTQPGLQARLDHEPGPESNDDSSKSSSPAPTETAAAIPIPERANESPLEMLFKADREQKAKRDSGGVTLTPPSKPAVMNGFFNSEPRPNNFQSIYGGQHHQRHPSNGSGREMFMMELDGREASPVANKINPPATAPRLGLRSVSDQHISPPGVNQGYPQKPPSPGFYHSTSTGSSLSSIHGAAQSAAPPIDQSYSPFNRGPSYPTQRSADSTPTPQQNSTYANQQNFHYGNRNLSPLFQAAKHTPTPRPNSSLRQEVHPHSPGQGTAIELPDNSAAMRPNNHNATQADRQAMAFLQTQAPNTATMPHIPLPKSARSTPSELDGQPSASNAIPTGVTPPGAYGPSTKSIEDDLKRMLKLTGGIK